MSTDGFTIGVEEEFLVVDAATGALRAEGPALLPQARARLGDDSELVARVRACGTGAERQRRVLAETGDHRAVVDFIVEETAPAAC